MTISPPKNPVFTTTEPSNPLPGTVSLSSKLATPQLMAFRTDTDLARQALERAYQQHAVQFTQQQTRSALSGLLSKGLGLGVGTAASVLLNAAPVGSHNAEYSMMWGSMASKSLSGSKTVQKLSELIGRLQQNNPQYSRQYANLYTAALSGLSAAIKGDAKGLESAAASLKILLGASVNLEGENATQVLASVLVKLYKHYGGTSAPNTATAPTQNLKPITPPDRVYNPSKPPAPSITPPRIKNIETERGAEQKALAAQQQKEIAALQKQFNDVKALSQQIGNVLLNTQQGANQPLTQSELQSFNTDWKNFYAQIKNLRSQVKSMRDSLYSAPHHAWTNEGFQITNKFNLLLNIDSKTSDYGSDSFRNQWLKAKTQQFNITARQLITKDASGQLQVNSKLAQQLFGNLTTEPAKALVKHFYNAQRWLNSTLNYSAISEENTNNNIDTIINHGNTPKLNDELPGEINVDDLILLQNLKALVPADNAIDETVSLWNLITQIANQFQTTPETVIDSLAKIIKVLESQDITIHAKEALEILTTLWMMNGSQIELNDNIITSTFKELNTEKAIEGLAESSGTTTDVISAVANEVIRHFAQFDVNLSVDQALVLMQNQKNRGRVDDEAEFLLLELQTKFDMSTQMAMEKIIEIIQYGQSQNINFSFKAAAQITAIMQLTELPLPDFLTTVINIGETPIAQNMSMQEIHNIAINILQQPTEINSADTTGNQISQRIDQATQAARHLINEFSLSEERYLEIFSKKILANQQNAIAIREGLVELAKFQQDGIDADIIVLAIELHSITDKPMQEILAKIKEMSSSDNLITMQQSLLDMHNMEAEVAYPVSVLLQAMVDWYDVEPERALSVFRDLNDTLHMFEYPDSILAGQAALTAAANDISPFVLSQKLFPIPGVMIPLELALQLAKKNN